jgi:phospholipid/cholesterol/gamma-HCH transport system ATP-binding protein
MELEANRTGNLVEVRGLRFARGSNRVFDGVDIDIRQGTVTAVMGPSGTGKTTLLRVITGQLTPDAGSVEVGGHQVPSLERAALFELRKSMGMLFQGGALLTDLTVFENVAFPLREHTRLPEGVIRQLVLTKLQAVGLRGAAELFPNELSGGMARRVALARSIALDPQLILYDEPFTGLDPISFGVIARLIRSLNDSLGATSVIVTHDVQEALGVVDHVYFMAAGRVIAKGAPAEIRASPEPFVNQFVNGRPDGPVPFHYAAPPYAADLELAVA